MNGTTCVLNVKELVLYLAELGSKTVPICFSQWKFYKGQLLCQSSFRDWKQEILQGTDLLGGNQQVHCTFRYSIRCLVLYHIDTHLHQSGLCCIHTKVWVLKLCEVVLYPGLQTSGLISEEGNIKWKLKEGITPFIWYFARPVLEY